MKCGVVLAAAWLVTAAAWPSFAETSPSDETAPEESEESEEPEPPPAIMMQVAPEAEPKPRPPPLEVPQPPSEPWAPRIELGPNLALVARPATTAPDGQETRIGFSPGIGWGVHGRIRLIDQLAFTGYFLDSNHTIQFGPGALGVGGDKSTESADAYSIGAKLSPTLELTDQLRGFLTVGVGWGRLEIDRVTVTDASGTYEIRERSTPFVEFPLGLGITFEFLPEWLSATYEITAAPVVDQEGDALTDFQAIDSNGQIQNIGAFPRIAGHFVQSFGLSLIL